MRKMCLLEAGKLSMRSKLSRVAFLTSAVSRSEFGHIRWKSNRSAFVGKSGLFSSHTPMSRPLLPAMSAMWLKVSKEQSTA